MTKLGNLEDHLVHFSDHRQGERVPVVIPRFSAKIVEVKFWISPVSSA